MAGFFEEIKRRKVYRVAAAYIVVAGGMIQLASAIFPAWEIPAWALRLLIVLLLAGFPIALILAWALEVTPEGIRTTPSLPTAPRRRRNVVALLAVGIIVSAGAGFLLLPRASAGKMDKSIAVLPFENFSEDKENAHFADGIQDDVLTNLSKISDLKVISRTSVMSYRGTVRNVREIAKALGVGAILEGSVRRIGNRVRVNVQLINGATDEHIWAQDYDRELTDVFAIQSELAHEIARTLRAKLSPMEKASMDRKPTQNTEAYLLYQEAHAFESKPDETPDDIKTVEQLLEKATQLDPSFALAYALHSRLESHIYHSWEPLPARIDKARALAAKAIRLEPDLPEAHLALGNCYYYGDRDYERALSEYEIARRGLPNNAAVYVAIAAIERRQGKWEQSIADWTKAATLDPKDANVWSDLAATYAAIKDFPAARKAYDRALEAAPNSRGLVMRQAFVEYNWNGDLTAIDRVLASFGDTADPDGHIASARFAVKLVQRRYDEARQILERASTETFVGEGGAPVPKTFLLGQLYLAAKDPMKARAAFESARLELEAAVVESPSVAARHVVLGQLYAGLDRREDAIREGKRAVELHPESVDAFEGPDILTGLAEIYAMLGDAGNAVPILEHSLSSKVGINPRWLLEPVWDPIRSDARFQELLAKYSAAK
jgi:TolB-like protein/Tfp pilus assembly protein PilF